LLKNCLQIALKLFLTVIFYFEKFSFINKVLKYKVLHFFAGSFEMIFFIYKSVVLLLSFSLVVGGGVEKYKSVSCSASNQTIFPNYTCFIKAMSRDVSTLNLRVHLQRPIFKMFVSLENKNLEQEIKFSLFFNNHLKLLQFDFESRYGQLSASYRSRKVINFNKYEGCSFLNRTVDNIGFKWLIGLVNSSLPENVIHACPYKV
jgi:hypothetical protein